MNKKIKSLPLWSCHYCGERRRGLVGVWQRTDNWQYTELSQETETPPETGKENLYKELLTRYKAIHQVSKGLTAKRTSRYPGGCNSGSRAGGLREKVGTPLWRLIGGPAERKLRPLRRGRCLAGVRVSAVMLVAGEKLMGAGSKAAAASPLFLLPCSLPPAGSLPPESNSWQSRNFLIQSPSAERIQEGGLAQ